MKYGITDNKLKTILNELGEEYKDLLISNLLEESGETDPERLSLVDLIRLDANAKKTLREKRKVRQLKKMVSALMMTGIAYTLLGLIIILYLQLSSNSQQVYMSMALIMCFLGMFVTVNVIIMWMFLRNKAEYVKPRISEYDIICKWKELEIAINKHEDEGTPITVHRALVKLKNQKILSDDDIKVIDQLREERNYIVHSNKREKVLSQQELRRILRNVDNILLKL